MKRSCPGNYGVDQAFRSKFAEVFQIVGMMVKIVSWIENRRVTVQAWGPREQSVFQSKS
jgi:hypothetical protein